MSKRQELRARRQREKIRNRILVILLVVSGALLIVFAMVLPTIKNLQTTTKATQNSGNAAQAPVNPITPRVINAPMDGVHIGNPNAPVKVDVYEDFQCPACSQYSQQTEPQIIQNYVEAGLVYYTYHFFPIVETFSSGNTESTRSAIASLCAAEQGMFWEYHDLLFANQNGENQGGFADSRLITAAETLGLEMSSFNQCFQENNYADQVKQDTQTGQAIGVSGTPTVFVNGVNPGTPGYIPTYEQISTAIEAALSGQ